MTVGACAALVTHTPTLPTHYARFCVCSRVALSPQSTSHLLSLWPAATCQGRTTVYNSVPSLGTRGGSSCPGWRAFYVSENPENEITMRQPCTACGTPAGVMKRVGHQDTVRCVGCGKHCYNAPRKETGLPTRRVNTREGMSPRIRARVLERALGRCELCGRGPGDGELHVGHLLSVKEGTELGLPDTVLGSLDNLACFCDACNLGAGSKSVSPLLLAALLTVRGSQ